MQSTSPCQACNKDTVTHKLPPCVRTAVVSLCHSPWLLLMLQVGAALPARLVASQLSSSSANQHTALLICSCWSAADYTHDS